MKKRLLSLALVLCMALALLPVGAAADETSDVLTYSIINDEVEIARCDMSAAGAVTIPDTIEGYPVTSIGDWSFEGCVDVTSVTIPDTVTDIGIGAFNYCLNLASVTIPNSVTRIGASAFSNTKLFNDPSNRDNGILYLGHALIDADDSITSCQIKAGTTVIAGSAFYDCTSLTSVTIPDSVTSIGESPFVNTALYDDPSNWDNGVLYIGNALIGSKYDITSCEIKAGTTVIADSAFYQRSSLASVTIPDSVTSIGDNAFNACKRLTSLTIPGSVRSIGDEAFLNCSGLTSLTISNGVTSIGNKAFDNCSGLKSVIIPKSVTSIGNDAFSYCSALTAFFVDIANTRYTSADGVLFNKNQTKLIQCPRSKDGSYSIPNGVRSIEDDAFSGCASLTSVTIPSSVTSIGDYAFFCCTGLTSVTIPDSVTSIEFRAFSGCTGLTSVTIPGSVTSIGDGAFSSCTGLTSVAILNGVTSIGGTAFSGCSNLASITIPDSVTSIDGWAFSDTKLFDDTSAWENGILYLGHGLIKAENGITSCQIKAGTTFIAGDAFSDCASLTSVTIPDSVTTIGAWAFSGCTGLTSITIPDSVTSIGACAFDQNCLQELTLGKNITDLDGFWDEIRDYPYLPKLKSITVSAENPVFSCKDNVLYSKDGKTLVLYPADRPGDFRIPDEVTTLAEGAFCGVRNLKQIDIPDTVRTMKSMVLSYNETAESVVLPEGLSFIPRSTFWYATNLKTVYIPESVILIGGFAFFRCPVQDVYFGGSEAQWNAITFFVWNNQLEYATIHYNHTHNWDDGVVTQAATETSTGEKKYTCTECGKTKYETIPKLDPVTGFTDVPADAFYAAPVAWAVENGITSGVGNNRFAPNDTCTRSQAVTFLWRAMGRPEPTSTDNPFTDVSESDWFYKPVLWAAESGVTSGVGGGRFDPNGVCSRSQIVTFLWRAENKPEPQNTVSPFEDVSENDWFYKPVLWAVEQGITFGVGNGRFDPDGTCTRGQIVTFLFRDMTD